MNDTQNQLIVIAGPTAVGKTDFAIEVAKHFNTEIISADSRQCFRELNIGVARPSKDELEQVPHHFIASHSITETINAAWYEQYALDLLQQLFQQYETLVLVGGTGLYIKALLEGLDNMPNIPDTIREKVIAIYHQEGLKKLHEILEQQQDPFLEKGEILNPQRVMRAVEVLLHTGNSITEFKKGIKAQRPFTIHFFGLEMDRALLYQRINTRVDVMMQEGLLEEVKSLFSQKHLNALQTVGYKELFTYLENKCTLNFAIEEIKKNTRHYAKRQITWFKKQDGITWLNPTQKQESFNRLIQKVQK